MRLTALVITIVLGVGCISSPPRSTPERGYSRDLATSVGGYLRYSGGDDVAGDLETAVRTFESKTHGTRITLVGMVHIADPEFYEEVTRRIEQGDCVLTEGVQGALEAFGTLGRALRAVELIRTRLDLASQKERLKDVRGVSYYWGDTNVEELMAALEGCGAEMGIPPLTVVRTLLGAVDVMLYANGVFGRRKSDLYRHVAAGLIAESDDEEEGMFELLRRHRDGTPLTSALLGAYRDELSDLDIHPSDTQEFLEELAEAYAILIFRNSRLFEELQARLAEGRWEHIVIPWGAAHMWDMEERIEELGYRVKVEEWITAWRIQTR